LLVGDNFVYADPGDEWKLVDPSGKVVPVNRQKGTADEATQVFHDLVDLKIQEASIRAERDALLEEVQKGKDADVQVRILADRYVDLQKRTEAEIAGLRRVLEKKAQEAGAFKQKLDEALATRKSEAELDAIFRAHQDELIQAVNDAKAETRAELLEAYFNRRLVRSNLQVDENSRALLEGCQNLGDVDALVDKLIGVARRSALHTKRLDEVKVQNTVPMDPEQRKVIESIGQLMEHLNF